MTRSSKRAPASTPDTTGASSAPSQRTNLLGTAMGNALEWFDWCIFAVFAPFFATQFFDKNDRASAFLSTLAVFAVGFAARPIGSILFGWISDRTGRKNAMAATVATSAFGGILIAVSPNYASIGVGASLILVVARLIQGLGHGGEVPSAQTYLSEIAPRERRGFWSSLIYASGMFGNMLGILLGVALTAALTSSQMSEFGWRIPFAVGGILGILALVMRYRMKESDVFESKPSRMKPRVWPELMKHQKQVLQIIGMTAGMTVAVYTWAISAPGYSIAVLGTDPNAALWAGVAATVVLIVALPFWGKLSDKIGRKPVLLISTIGSAAALYPASSIMQGEAWQLAVAMGMVVFLLAAALSIIPAATAEMFPTGIRTIGVGLPMAVTTATFGGTAPYLQTWMSIHLDSNIYTGYVVIFLVISAITCATLPETNQKNLHDLG
ncbi:MFS transporter [Rhodococcus qingshengii]|uniref:MFS transporter n=1 Tax=Rhodococcus qingshengii TaxID=334542 RepID=UPI0033F3ABE9